MVTSMSTTQDDKLSKTAIVWLILICIAISFTAIEVPISFALNLKMLSWQFWIGITISLLFLIDIVFTIRRFLRRKKSTRNYTTFFIFLGIDIVATIPYDLLSYAFGFPPAMRILRLLRLFRLVRIMNISSTIRSILVIPNIVKIPFIFICSIIAVTWIACGHMLIYPLETGGNIATFINMAFYWTITTLTTVGYGDITPTDNSGRLYTMFVMITGVGMYGVVIGVVSRIIAMADRYKEQSREKIRDITAFMNHYNIPTKLKNEVFDYYNHLLDKRLSEDDSTIISELPVALQAELKIYMNIKLIAGVPAFKNSSHNCLKEIAKILEQIYFSPGQSIIKTGDIGNEMFIIGHGQVEIIVNQNRIAHLGDGQFFGEIALLEETVRNADVVSTTYCDLYKLSKENFLKTIKKHPELLTCMKKFMSKK